MYPTRNADHFVLGYTQITWGKTIEKSAIDLI